MRGYAGARPVPITEGQAGLEGFECAMIHGGGFILRRSGAAGGHRLFDPGAGGRSVGLVFDQVFVACVGHDLHR